MPLYEFYCGPCHTIFTFHARRVDTVSTPACPRCGAGLKRQVSPFAHIVKGATGEQEDTGDFDQDEVNAARMELAADSLGRRLEALEDGDADPRDAVRVMRELAQAGGLNFKDEVREAMARIEAGEDPEKVEEQFAEVFDSDNPFESATEAGSTARGLLKRLRGPERDPRWYDL